MIPFGPCRRPASPPVLAIVLALVVALSAPILVGITAASGAEEAPWVADRTKSADAGPIASAERSIPTSEGRPGDAVSVRLEIELDAKVSRLSITETFDPTFADVGSVNVSFEGGSGSTLAASADTDLLTVAVQDVANGTTVVVTYQVRAADSGGTTHTFSGSVTAGSQTESIAGDDEIAVVSDTATGDGDGDGSDDGDGSTDDDGRVELVDGGTYFIGQSLETAKYDAGDDVVLRDASGTFITDVPVGSDGVVALGTTSRDAGQYQLTSPSGPTVEFDLVRQTYVVSASPTTVNPGGSNTVTELTITSNRAGFENVLTTAEFSTLELDRLLTGVNGTERDLDGDGSAESLLVGSASNEDTLAVDFAGVEPGTYTITLSVLDTTASDSVTVRVEGGTPGTAEFGVATKVVQGNRSSVIDIPIQLQDATTATLYLGSPNLNYLVRLQVRDGGSADGTVTVYWDTAVAGSQAGASAAFSTADADDSVSATRLTAELSGPLAAETYPMNLSVDDRETDVGTVALQEGGQTRVCDRDATPLIQEFNANVNAIPGFASGLVTDKRIHGIVTGDDGGEYTIVTGADKRVTSFSEGAPADPSLVVETDCETFRAIVDAQDAVDLFNRAYENGDVSIRGSGIFGSILVEAIELVVKLAQSLGLL